MQVHAEKDELEIELSNTITCYDDDVAQRDKFIEDMEANIANLEEQLSVVKRERSEAYEERDMILQELYEAKKDNEELTNEITQIQTKYQHLKVENQIKEVQVSMYFQTSNINFSLTFRVFTNLNTNMRCTYLGTVL